MKEAQTKKTQLKQLKKSICHFAQHNMFAILRLLTYQLKYHWNGNIAWVHYVKPSRDVKTTKIFFAGSIVIKRFENFKLRLNISFHFQIMTALEYDI